MIPKRTIEDHIEQLQNTNQYVNGFFVSDTTIPMDVVDKPHRSEFYAIKLLYAIAT